MCRISYLCMMDNLNGTMNIYDIEKLNLSGRNFAFRTISEFLGTNYQDQLYVYDGVLFHICIRGTAKITIDYKEYPVAANSMVVLLPKHICSIGDCSEDLHIILISVSVDYLCHLPIMPDFNLLKKIAVRPCVKLGGRELDDLQKIHSVINRYDSDDNLSCQIQNTLIHSMILMIASSFENQPQNTDRIFPFSRQEILVRKFFDLLIDSCEMERSVSYYADKLCVTPKYLTTVIRSVSNHPARNWINEAVLVRAKHYVMTTDLTIHQIADKLHFLTASSFVRFFRIHAGCSPLDYRKRANQEV